MKKIPLIISALIVTASIAAIYVPAGQADAASPTKATSQKSPPKELDLDYIGDLEAWRERVGISLKRDNGWLTLAGRFVMKEGVNTFGTGADNNIVFPPELKGVGPARLGNIVVDSKNKSVTLQLVEGATWNAGNTPFTGSRMLGTSTDKRDWVSMENIAMHVIERDGKYILRLADNKSSVRANFQGRLWYPPSAEFLVEAKYFTYPPGRTISIVNVLDEVSDEPSPGYVEFSIRGSKHKLDAVGDGDGLFFVIRDGTSGDTTYRPSRFLSIEKKPEPAKTFLLDFNRAYNPPCAFSEFTTCPLPPKQNILHIRLEAGEKYRKPG